MIDLTKCPKNKIIQIFNPDNTLLIETNNEIMFYYIFKEIVKHHYSGYYFVFEGKRYLFDERVVDKNCFTIVKKLVKEIKNYL